MADLSFVLASVYCAHCGGVADEVPQAFRWGYAIGSLPRDEDSYEPGDAIRWRKRRDGSIPPWVWFQPSEGGGANLGDPAVSELLVLGGPAIQWGSEGRCLACSAPFGWVPIGISGGAVASVGPALPLAAFAGEIEHFELRAGTWVPRQDWIELPRMSPRDGG